MAKISLCMMVSDERFRYVRAAIDSAIRLVDPFEVLIGLSPERQTLKDAIIRTFGKPGVSLRVLPGTANRNGVFAAKAALYSSSKGDWIVNLDDDDMALAFAVDLDALPEKVGSVHGNTFALCTEKVEFREPFDVFMRESKTITNRIDANLFRGSFYAFRKRAWVEVCESVDTSYMAYEEWRTVWHMLRRGWKDYYTPGVASLQRVGDYAAAAGAAKDAGMSWQNTYAQLEDGGKERWWQTWNREGYADWIEDFWQTEKQTERRKSLYRVLRKLRKEHPQLTNLLDLPCGTGVDYPFLVEQGFKYAGADVTPEMLDKFCEKHPDVNIEFDDAFRSRYADNQWQVVLDNALLLHLPFDRVEEAVRELWRITKDVLIIRLPLIDHYPEDRTRVAEGFIVTAFREDTLKSMFDRLSPEVKRLEIESDEIVGIKVYSLWKR